MPTPPFLLTTAQMRRPSPHFPLSHGLARVDDRCVLSGIIYVIRNGRQWRPHCHRRGGRGGCPLDRRASARGCTVSPMPGRLDAFGPVVSTPRRLRQARGGRRPRPFAGWRVVAGAFLLVLAGFGAIYVLCRLRQGSRS